MHRFVIDYYGKPVAVNDLGLVAYKNGNFVLDQAGLASIEVFRHRRNADDPAWMNELATTTGVELVMIYKTWFETIPDARIEVGSLNLGDRLISIAHRTVTFYALNQAVNREIVDKLQEFQATLCLMVWSLNSPTQAVEVCLYCLGWGASVRPWRSAAGRSPASGPTIIGMLVDLG